MFKQPNILIVNVDLDNNSDVSEKIDLKKYLNYIIMFNSQDNQDMYLENNIFKGYKNGFYVDVGAHDCISINNTLYFEKNNNWTGINIELIKKNKPKRR